MAFRVQIRRGTASEWSASNPILLDGEFAVEKDTRKFKIGDGTTAWNSLPYATQGETGKSIQYVWDGTRLGLRREGEASYAYTNLKGEKGDAGTTSWLGILDKPTEFPPALHNHNDSYNTKTEITNILKGKVDITAGKGLSTNDYTNEDKGKTQTNYENVNNLNAVRIHEGTTEPTDTKFWYDPNDDARVSRKLRW